MRQGGLGRPHSLRCWVGPAHVPISRWVYSSLFEVGPSVELHFIMHRSYTTDLTTFNLPFPDAATCVFTSSSPASTPTSRDAIRITIPPSSRWCMPRHWHPSENHSATVSDFGCDRVTCLSGHIYVYIANGIANYHELGSRGMSVKFPPGCRRG
jgi:hypothetical protein